MMKIKYVCILLIAALAYSCDDSTTGIGDSIIPDKDHIPAGAATYNVSTRSILVDSVYARTSTAYLGRYTDPQFGEFTADFMAQFNCIDNFEFPDSIKEITGLTLFFQYTSFFGDSLNAMRLRVDTLDKVIPEKAAKAFYTNVDPTVYYNENAKAIAEKAFSAGGASVDTIQTSNGVKYYTQSVKLPINLGKFMYQKYEENKNNYKDSEAFIKNVFKGVYVRCTHGDGTIVYIDNLLLRLNYKRLIARKSTGKIDSLVNDFRYFGATKEVIQANRFQNSDQLKELVKEPDHTFIKTPAGILTEATLPIDEIAEAHKRDTLNAASITFTRYKDNGMSTYKMGIPQYLLMVRKKEMYSFFEENKMFDNQSSYIASYVLNQSTGTKGNAYSFTNIAQLISSCVAEKKKGLADDPAWLTKNPDWDKVVLIPVKVDTDLEGNIIGVKNNLSLESATFKGGTNPDNKLKMQVLYTTF